MPGSRLHPTVIRVEFDTDRASTWAFLTDPALVESRLARATPVGPAGSAHDLDFGGGDLMHGEVLEVVPGERFACSWGWGETPPATRKRVTWDLAPGEGGTLVTLTHSGWTEAGLGAKDRDEHRASWEDHVAALVEATDGVVAGEGA